MSSGTFALASLLMLAVGFAAEARATTNAYLVRHWQTPGGLPENLVASVVQTRDGYLWVGTYGGLTRFDGSRFVTFGVHNADAFPTTT
jgi:ligand-binding sensor domain-containing protein